MGSTKKIRRFTIIISILGILGILSIYLLLTIIL